MPLETFHTRGPPGCTDTAGMALPVGKGMPAGSMHSASYLSPVEYCVWPLGGSGMLVHVSDSFNQMEGFSACLS